MGSHFGSSSSPVKRGKLNSDKMVDAEAVKKICDIYDWDGKGELDLYFLGDVMYALGMNTTKKVCVGLGQVDEEGKKFAKFDDIVSKVNEAKNTPNSSGNYHDYIELLKLYEKTATAPCWVMRSPRRMCRSCSPSWLTPKMRRASSPTLPSSTDCAARPKQLSSLNIPISFGTSTEDHCTGRSKVGQSLQTKTKLIENKNTIKNKPKTECICEHLTNTIIGLKCDN